jgi:hypothetical protein
MNVIRTVVFAALMLGFTATHRADADNLSYHGGPIMQTARAIVIFWLPPGQHFLPAPQNTAAQDQLYETTITNFFNRLSGSSYLNILPQYVSQCAANTCQAPQNPGGVALGQVITDLSQYPQSPLQDSDVQNLIKNHINSQGLAFNLNTIFLVYTAFGIQECNGFSGCTSTNFCAYHNEFDFNNGKVVYAFMPNDNSLGGCSGNNSTAPNQLAADREVEFTSHELFEAITDPEPFGSALNIFDPTGNTAWWEGGNIFDGTFGSEIGDKCNQNPASVTLGGKNFIVQQQWSNDSATCVSSFGPSVTFIISTGSDDLRGDSSATAALQAPNGGALQTITLKSQSQGSWGNNSTNGLVTALRPSTIATSTTPLGSIGITLTSHNSGFETNDNWNIENVSAQMKNPSGGVFCSLSQGGDPLRRLTGSVPTAEFALQCPPPVKPPPATFDTITFIIQTGGDDLRGDSSANAALDGPGSATFQTVTLKTQSQNGWPNNSTNTVSTALTPATALAAFSSVVMTLTSHNGTFESDDNWNVQAVNVTLSNSTNGQSACLANVNGNPFVRLTGSAGSVVINAGQGC